MVSVVVIVPTFNDSQRLVSCLDALMRQELDCDFKVCVVDNGSSVLPDISRYDSRVLLLSELAPGSYAARNSAIKATSSQSIAFTDSDCLPDKLWLQSGLNRLKGLGKAGMVGGRVSVVFSDVNKPTWIELYESVFAFQQLENVEAGKSVTANLFVDREVFKSIGFFEEKTFSGADFEFTSRATKAGFPIVYEPSCFVLHPARKFFSEYRSKLERTAGGVWQLAELSPSTHSERFGVWGLCKDVLRPFVVCSRLVRSRRFSLSDWLKIIKISVVIFHNGWYTLLLKIGFKLGFISSRSRS